MWILALCMILVGLLIIAIAGFAITLGRKLELKVLDLVIFAGWMAAVRTTPGKVLLAVALLLIGGGCAILFA